MRNKLFLSVIATVLLLGGLSVYWWYQEEPSGPPAGTPTYVLILGVDGFGENERSDTIMVAKLETGASGGTEAESGEDAENGRKVKLLSIPRDLRVQFPNGSFHKINAAYARGDADLARRIISEVLGIPLRWYAVVDFEAFREIIDAVGGVTVTIEEPMQYEDTKQGLVIDLPAGEQTLSGEQALDFWRYRDEKTGDVGRIRRQQRFLSVLTGKLSEIESADEIRALVRTAMQHVRTNIAIVDAYGLAEQLRGLSPEDLKTEVLPGHAERIDEVSYYVANPVETDAVVEEFFRGREVLTNRDVRVIVLNGHPDEEVRPGLARKTSEYLGRQGFEVVAYWNADAFDYSRSYLIDVSDQEAKVRRLANSLQGIPLAVLSREGFGEQMGQERLREMEKTLLTTRIPPNQRGVELNEADAVLILGDGFTQDVIANGRSEQSTDRDADTASGSE